MEQLQIALSVGLHFRGALNVHQYSAEAGFSIVKKNTDRVNGILSQSSGQRSSCTHKCDCPFQVNSRLWKAGWRITKSICQHNHEPSSAQDLWLRSKLPSPIFFCFFFLQVKVAFIDQLQGTTVAGRRFLLVALWENVTFRDKARIFEILFWAILSSR